MACSRQRAAAEAERWADHRLSAEDDVNQRGWLVAYWTLFGAFLGTAALNMLHVRGGVLTNHAVGLATCYVMDRRALGRAERLAAGDRESAP